MTDNANHPGAVPTPAARRRSLLAPLAAALVLAGCVMQPASTKAAARGASRLRLRAAGVGTAPG